jgi:hypothetical protein
MVELDQSEVILLMWNGTVDEHTIFDLELILIFD